MLLVNEKRLTCGGSTCLDDDKQMHSISSVYPKGVSRSTIGVMKIMHDKRTNSDPAVHHEHLSPPNVTQNLALSIPSLSSVLKLH